MRGIRATGEAAARPAGVGGLRYLPAVQSRVPDTFIRTMILVRAVVA